MLIETTIKAAIRNAPTSGKRMVELKDAGARGEGRLSLQIRVAEPPPGEETGRITAEWYAVFYRGGRRALAKVGTYPTLSLADARKTFKEKYQPAILRGEAPEGKKLKPKLGRTVKDLFQAYVDDLVAQGKNAYSATHYLLGSENDPVGRWKGKRLEGFAKQLGEGRLACEIEPSDITPLLSKIHGRGAVSSAAHGRSYLSSAFNFAMKSTNSYHRPAGAVAWGVTINPVLAIPSDPNASKAGTRHLTPAEFRHFWHWLDERWARSAAAPAVQLIMATGQRPGEILRLGQGAEAAEAFAKANGPTVGSMGLYDVAEATVFWSKTKNKKSHLLPLTPQSADILSRLRVSGDGLYFQRPGHPSKALTIGAPEALINRYLKQNPTVAHFTPRDLRRTWKTLAGAAGLSKEIRDRLQNHAESDVSSRHYDRYEYLAEKRAAVKLWGEYLARILAGQIDTPVVEIGEKAA